MNNPAETYEESRGFGEECLDLCAMVGIGLAP